jgi:hypothetical protein
VRWIAAFFAAAIERRLVGDQNAVFLYSDSAGEDKHIDDSPAGGVRHAVEIAADADHAFMRGASLQSEHRLIGRKRQRPTSALTKSRSPDAV